MLSLVVNVVVLFFTTTSDNFGQPLLRSDEMLSLVVNVVVLYLRQWKTTLDNHY